MRYVRYPTSFPDLITVKLAAAWPIGMLSKALHASGRPREKTAGVSGVCEVARGSRARRADSYLSALRIPGDVCLGCAPCKGGAFQWVQAPPGNRSSRKQSEQSWR